MSERVIVSVNEGKIKGIKGSSKYSGAEFYSFYGVPYGQPPVSNFRFKDPVKVKPWKTTYDATREKPGCIQFSLKELQITGNEDCLFNNIHTPKLPGKNEPLRPVIVNIHPGGFLFGTPNGDHYGSTEFIMHCDIVYVIIAYRLHVFVKMTDRIVVSVKEGKVRGIKRTSKYSGAVYYSFFGVPYGQPPIGSLRFKDPVKAKPWKDIYDATIEKPGCAQFSLKLCRFAGSEDCLFNNIHTAELPTKSTSLRPVIAVIHPGGYLHGSPNEDEFGTTTYFMHHDIVYVGIAHRLHILGLLNLGIKECSGNQCIKDIILSLQWLKENISSFGGDPENITVMGSSSGAGTIHAMTLSPVAKGLFHKAVIMAANIFDPTVPVQNTNEHVAFKLACFLGYKGNAEDKKKLLSFYKKINPVQLIAEQRLFLVKEFRQDVAPIHPCGIFLPTIDQGENAVLPEFPRNLIPSTSRIPFIIGYGEREAALGFARGPVGVSGKRNFKTTIRQNAWGWGRELTDDDIEKINEQVETFCLEGKPMKQASLSNMIDVQTGAMMSDVYDTLINVVSPDAPVYVYKFQFEGEMMTIKNSFINLFDERLPGTFHGDDACYWNCMSEPSSGRTKEMVDTFTKIITTFARNGDPNFEELQVHWRPTKPDSPCYLNINHNMEMIDSRLHEEKLVFWDKIKKEFGKADDAETHKSDSS